MYVRGYLQGSENGRVVTIGEMTACLIWKRSSMLQLILFHFTLLFLPHPLFECGRSQDRQTKDFIRYMQIFDPVGYIHTFCLSKTIKLIFAASQQSTLRRNRKQWYSLSQENMSEWNDAWSVISMNQHQKIQLSLLV